MLNCSLSVTIRGDDAEGRVSDGRRFEAEDDLSASRCFRCSR